MAAELDKWLEGLGLSKYAPLFVANEVDLEVLPELTEQDLKDLDIPLGPRKKLLKAISALSRDGASLNDATPSLSPAPVASPASGAADDAERRQLTILFSDLVGSTALSTRLDPEELREVIRRYQDVCAKAVARYHGYVAKFMGDGVLAYFGYPRAHENDPERAVLAGLDIVEAVVALGKGSSILKEAALAVRVGINTGLVVVGDIVVEGASEEASVTGEAPNVAARLQALARPNQVVMGPLTRQLVGRSFECVDLGENKLKGVAFPVRAWGVLREREAESGLGAGSTGSPAPLVGRQEELGLLLRAWEESKRGHGQVVSIQGEAGIGKSRLLLAMRERIAGEDYVWIPIRCSPYHVNSALYPVIEHLKRALGWRPDDGDDVKLQKLEAALARQSASLERTVPLLGELLSLAVPESRYTRPQLGAQERRQQTLDALASWLFEEAERQPVLQVWEDLHWADATTLELLRLYIDQSPTEAMMNVVTYRPDFVPGWPVRSHMIPITLNRLERPAVEAIIAQLAGSRALPQAAIDRIVEKTDGVPLFVEELTKAMLERRELAGAPADIAIPATLQDLLMARLDRLPSIREVAQIGSIIGREFAYEMLQAIASLEETELQNGLDRLVEAELLYQRGRRPRARYTFKHALVQDAAYQSLLNRTRQYYHRQVAELLEDSYPEVVRTQPDLVAHHYSRAKNDAKAIEYLTCAADLAGARYAHAEAIAELEQACSHAERLPAGEREAHTVALVVREAQSLHFLGRREEIIALLTHHRAALGGVTDSALIAQYHFWLGFAHSWLGHRSEAAGSLTLSLDQAKRSGDKAITGRVHRALATECLYSGRPLADAVAHGKESVALLEETEDRLWLGQALFTLSYCCVFAGDFESALDAASRLERFGETAGIRRAQANGAMLAGLSLASRGEGSAGIALCERALDVSPDTFETAFILACLGYACGEAGELARAVSVLEQAIALADKVRSLQFRAWFRTMLGEAYLRSGDCDSATRVVQQAMAASTESAFKLGVGLSDQVLGRIARAQGLPGEARLHLAKAQEIFAALGARFELGRTCLELAELSLGEGRRDEATRLLRETRALFTALRAPVWLGRAEALAGRHAIPLAEMPTR